ncbi:MAG: apolipoprotein N-acyltransferase [Pseudomonadota bacterium]|nr:apolipoprotein N-acyltransferase [Pseudomonadota bacterium]
MRTRDGSGELGSATRRRHPTLPYSFNALTAPFRAVDRIEIWLRELSGWWRYVVAFFSGGLATLALPPVDYFPALVVSATFFVWQLEASAGNHRASFALGWFFGFGYFAIGLYWIGNALLIFGERHAWMLPLSALGLPAFLAGFTGVAALIASGARGRMGTILAVSTAFATADWLRGNMFTGLPWNLFGHAWSGIDPLLQSASIYGVYGVGLLALLSAMLPAGLAGGIGRRRIAFGIAAIALLGCHWGYGELRLTIEPPRNTGIGIRLVQANIPQREKWDTQYRERNIAAHYRLSRESRPDWIDHVIWPEMAATFYLDEDTQARKWLAGIVPSRGLLLTGAPRRERGVRGSFNSIFALDEKGKIVGHYDKAHLVPFGEYVPLASLLPVDKITEGAVGYRPGDGVKTLRLPGLPAVSLLVCYEVIFPGAVIDRADPPAAIINFTNDAWYGVSAGPHQHFANSRVRAVEEGLPLIRAAYTGISGAVDAYGRVLGTIPLNSRGYLDVHLPKALPERPLYSRFGDLIFAIMLGICAVTSVVFSRR